MKYRALVGLSVPVDEKEDTRIRAARDAGAPLPMEERRMRRYEPGEVADFIPELSVGWLLEQGCIEETDDG